MPRIVKHTTWLLNRYPAHDDELASYQKRCQQQSNIGVAEFGKTVYFKAHGKNDVANAESSATKGMWLRQDSDNSEHLVAPPHGVVQSRTFKRVTPSDKWNNKLFRSIKMIPMKSERKRHIRSLIFLMQQRLNSFVTSTSGTNPPPPGLDMYDSAKGPREEGPEDVQRQAEPIQENQKELSLQYDSTTPVPHDGTFRMIRDQAHTWTIRLHDRLA